MSRRIFLYLFALAASAALFWYWMRQEAQIAQIEAGIEKPYEKLSEWVRRTAEEIRAEKAPDFQRDYEKIQNYPGAKEALIYQPTAEELAKIREINGPRLPDVDTSPPSAGEELRIGLINDFQAGASGKVFPDKHVRVVKPKYLKRINYFLEQMHANFKPHFMISPGDIIEGTNRITPTGIAELRAIKHLFDSRSNIPMYWAPGNHELRSVTMEQFLAAMNMKSRRYVFDIGDYRVIVTGANYDELGRIPVPKHNFVRGNFAARELLWLEQKLRRAQKDGKIVLVFSHQPPLSALSGRSRSGLPIAAEEVERLFARYNVAAVFSGHIEKNFYKELNGVKYFGTTGIKKNPRYLGTFAQIRLKGRDVDVEIFYIDPQTGEYVQKNLKENFSEKNDDR